MRNWLMSGAAALSLGAALPAGTNSAQAEPAKNVIMMIADGAGYNTLEATRMFTGAPLVADGPGWQGAAMSVSPLRRGIAVPTGLGPLDQQADQVYDSARIWNTTPIAGNSAVADFGAYPAGFAGYEYSRASYPDSANTASSLVNGVKSYNNAVNVNGALEPLTTLPQVAASRGRSAGVVSTVQFSDATPSATGGAHNVARANANAPTKCSAPACCR